MKVDVVTTATLRPELLNLTYRSFFKNCLRQCDDVRLIINIDPIGGEYTQQDVLDVAHQFSSNVVCRMPDTPSFPKAVAWGWGEVKSDLFLHLEDDWLLKKKVDARKIFECFESNDNLAQIVMNPSKNKIDSIASVSLRPSFIRKRFVDHALPYFDLEKDPEKQWQLLVDDGVFSDCVFSLLGGKEGGRQVLDIGKKWRKALGMKKTYNGSDTWLPMQKNRSVLLDAKLAVFMMYWKFLSR